MKVIKLYDSLQILPFFFFLMQGKVYLFV
uniref:Uncharacterized protein n=1 Tax=Rhizophora mucronata TaxID=61149 RepID=A0A2P2KHR6_RHIMU